MSKFLIDDNIDWRQLREQKLSLQYAISTINKKDSVNLIGILNLICSIQDNAVTSGAFLKKEVFGE